jgi:hypothetical protein
MQITEEYLIEKGFEEFISEEITYYRIGNYILTPFLKTYAIVAIVGNEFAIGELTLTTIQDLHKHYLESTGSPLI